GRQRQAACEGLHFLLQHGLGFAPRLGMGGDQQILDDRLLFGLEERDIDGDALEIALGGKFYHDKATARCALHFDLIELSLHLLHFCLELGGLFHHAHEIHVTRASIDARVQRSSFSEENGISLSPLPAWISCESRSGPRTSTISAPGKRVSTACTNGSARTPRINSARCASSCDFTVGAPVSLETTTIQRLPVHSESFRDNVVTSVFTALGSSAISRRPSSQRTNRTSRSRAVLTCRSRLSAARASTSSNRDNARTGAASSTRSTGSPATIAPASAARGTPRGVSNRGAAALVAFGCGVPPRCGGADVPVPLSASERTTSSGVGRSAT